MPHPPLAVVPILIGPIQVLLAILPAILVAVGGALLALFKPSSIKLGLKILWRNKVATLLTAAAVAGLVFVWPHVRGFLGRGQAAAFAGKAEWTMFRGGLSRRGGGMDGAADPSGGGRVWAFAPRFKTYYSSPTVIGNRVLASAADKGVFADRGAVVCLDAQSGGVVWEFAPSDFRATFSSPSVDGRYVVCGEGLHLTHDARIVCLAFETGRKLWEVRTTSHVESSPALLDGLAFCGAGADGVYAMRLDTPAGRSPVVWHLKGVGSNASFHCDASLAAVDGRVYISSAALHDGDWSGIACVEAATGKLIWQVETEMPVWGSPTVAGGRVYVGMGNGNYVESAEQYWARKQEELQKRGRSREEIAALAPRYAAGGELWCLDARSGRPVWPAPYKLRQTLLGCVAEADGKLYFSGADGLFTCLTTDREPVAQWDAHEGIKTSPAVGRDHVYVATDSGRLFILDRRTLRPVWQTRLGNGDLFTSSPAVGGGHVYIGTPMDGLVCMGQPSGAGAPPVWAGLLGGPGRGGWIDGSPLPPRGTFAWRWPADAGGEAGGAAAATNAILGPAAFADGLLYAPVAGPAGTGIVALAVGSSAAGAPPRAAAPETRWFFRTEAPPGPAIAVGGGRLYFVEGDARAPVRRLHGLNATNGAPLFAQEFRDAGASGAFTLADDTLYAFTAWSRPSNLEARDPATGLDRGFGRTDAAGTSVGAPCAAGELVLVAAADPASVRAVPRGGDAARWHRPLPADPVAGPVAGADAAAVATTNALVALSLVNGGILWSFPCAPSGVPLAADEDRIACTTAGGEVLLLDWRGRLLLRVKGALPGLPPMLCGDKVLVCKEGAIHLADAATRQEVRWLATAWMGALAAPPVLADGNVYFATADKGLVCARQGKR